MASTDRPVKQPPSYESQELRELAEVVQGRRTIDQFLQTGVPIELVHEAIEMATWAPNHHVTEPWHFHLVGRQTKERLLDLCYDLVLNKKNAKAADFKRESWAENRLGRCNLRIF